MRKAQAGVVLGASRAAVVLVGGDHGDTAFQFDASVSDFLLADADIDSTCLHFREVYGFLQK